MTSPHNLLNTLTLCEVCRITKNEELKAKLSHFRNFRRIFNIDPSNDPTIAHFWPRLAEPEKDELNQLAADFMKDYDWWYMRDEEARQTPSRPWLPRKSPALAP